MHVVKLESWSVPGGKYISGFIIHKFNLMYQKYKLDYAIYKPKHSLLLCNQPCPNSTGGLTNTFHLKMITGLYQKIMH